ncbi:MAG: hypothetical protein M1546_27055 [Chloroflexi bacterium]|nr:hypothetical protein [Chloroflexota bacterium]
MVKRIQEPRLSVKQTSVREGVCGGASPNSKQQSSSVIMSVSEEYRREYWHEFGDCVSAGSNTWQLSYTWTNGYTWSAVTATAQ